MKNLIKRILKESEDDGFDWIRDIKPILEVGDPISLRNPKKAFKIHYTHSYTRNEIYADNSVIISEEDYEGVARIIRLLDLLGKGVDSNDMAKMVLQHNWILSPNDINRLKNDFSEDEWGGDDFEDQAREWIQEDLRDLGLEDYDESTDDYAPLHGWWVTYFDEFGVEHHVKTNIA